MLKEPRVLDDRYNLMREIHDGDRCTIYQAKHSHTHRNVAIKLLKLSHVERHIERAALLGEARLLSEIRHVAIPDVLDAGVVSCSIPKAGQPYIVMEMIEGRSLAGLLAARRQLDIPLALLAAQTLAAALCACHGVGLIHQDVRPANLLLPVERAHRDPEMRGAPLKLVDFDAALRSKLSDGAIQDRTYHGYVAPEQQHGGKVDVRTDVFAVGVVLYQCLTGELPFPADGSFSVSARPPSEHREGIPKSLDELVLHAIAPNITARFENMTELSSALDSLSLEEPVEASVSASPPVSLVPSPSIAPESSRRRFPRAAYMTPVRLIRGDDTVIDCTTEDISVGGLQLFGPRVLDDDEEVVGRFALPISGQIVSVRSVGRWHRNAHAGAGATGVSFSNLTPEAAQEIAKYVEFFSDAP